MEQWLTGKGTTSGSRCKPHDQVSIKGSNLFHLPYKFSRVLLSYQINRL